ncbi:RICIN domain-containing protein [Streptomyces phaeochromogenes]|uniref:RICIN domain-containing protein n=1 Tax=Streptomyces phaeochromogenes TaxID=1923 RepID=UPI0036A38556
MRRNRLALAVAGSALALSGAMGTHAAAADVEGVAVLATETYQNRATNRCMDDSNFGLRPVGCHFGTTQQWTVTTNGSYRQLKSVGTGRCLDDSDLGFRTVGCHSGTTQQWTVIQLGGGYIQFKNRGTGRCADDSSGAGLRTWTCWAATDSKVVNQSWF